MKPKKIIKILVDILMYADFVVLMSHGVLRQLMMHGVVGIVLFVLFIIHHFLNTGFYKSTFKGRYNPVRILFSATTWILFALMILMAVTSVLMSGAVFEFSAVPMVRIGRTLHTCSCSWAYCAMSFHLGLHLYVKIRLLEKRKILFSILCAVSTAAGIFCFIKVQLYVFLFCTGGWKMAAQTMCESTAEYMGITLLFVMISYFARTLCARQWKGAVPER